DSGNLADEIADIPRRRFKLLTAAGLCIRPSRRADCLAVNQQVDARLSFVTAAANQETDKFAFNFELGRSQFARRSIAAQEAVHQPFPQKAAYRHLSRQRTLCRSSAKCGARHLPMPIIITLKVSQENVVAIGRGLDVA